MCTDHLDAVCSKGVGLAPNMAQNDEQDLVTVALERESLAMCAFDDALSGERPGYTLTNAVAEVLGLTEDEDFIAISNFLRNSPFGWKALDSWQEFVAAVNAFSSQRTTLQGVNMVLMRSAIKYGPSPPSPLAAGATQETPANAWMRSLRCA